MVLAIDQDRLGLLFIKGHDYFRVSMDGMKLRRIRLTLRLSCAVLATGCRSASLSRRENAIAPTIRSENILTHRGAGRSGRSDRQAALAEDESRSSDIEQVSARTAADSPAEALVGSPRLTIRQAIETALAQNPDLIAQRQVEGVSAAALGVAQTYPFNPFVQVQTTPYQDARNAGPGTTYHYVLLMQQIQLGHHQQFREEAAGAALNSVRWTLLQAELQDVAQTQRLYFTALYQQELRDLARATADNNQHLLTILEKQSEAGPATAADVAMVRLYARATRQQFQRAEANYQSALLDLRRQLGLSHDFPLVLDGGILRWN